MDELKEGNVYCDECGGEGILPKDPEWENGLGPIKLCKKCLGSGQLDWIERVVGKTPKDDLVIDLDVNQLYPETINFNFDFKTPYLRKIRRCKKEDYEE